MFNLQMTKLNTKINKTGQLQRANYSERWKCNVQNLFIIFY